MGLLGMTGWELALLFMWIIACGVVWPSWQKLQRSVNEMSANQKALLIEAQRTNLFLMHVAEAALLERYAGLSRAEQVRQSMMMMVQDNVIRGVSTEDDIKALLKEQVEERRRERTESQGQ